MSVMNDGGPAFPVPNDAKSEESGMTLRDWFAGQALQGWLSGPCQGDALDDYQCDEPRVFAEHQAAVATACYGYADAMLNARDAKTS